MSLYIELGSEVIFQQCLNAYDHIHLRYAAIRDA